MIGKAKSISHGINDIRYITGESRNKKHPERIFHVGDNLLPPGLDATGIWDSMRLTLEKSKRVKNSVIRIEVSPAPEHTKDFTIDDWQRLWDDFTDEFDNIELLDKNGKTYSPKTALKGSKGTVWLHLESKSGIPHLHGAFCRIDERGNINNDHDIHLRAQRAAERVALKRGWTTAAEVRETNIGQVNRDCMETLQSMESWSWDEYVARLRSKGYEFWELRDNKKILRGYVLKKGNARYKASELGRGRNLMATNLKARGKSCTRLPRQGLFRHSPPQGNLYRLHPGRFRFTHKERHRFRNTPAIVPVPARTISTSTGKAAGSSFPMKRWTYSMTSSTTGRQPTAVTSRTWLRHFSSGCSILRRFLREVVAAVPTTCLGEDARTRTNGNGHAGAPVKRQG